MWGKVVVALCVVVSLAVAQNSPLVDYVRAPDPYYSYNVSSEVKKEIGFTVYNLYLTSQKWLNSSLSSKPIWRHWVQVCIPDYYKQDKAFLWIGGGSDEPFDDPPDDFGNFGLFTELICETSQSVVGYIRQIPDEPIEFLQDPKHKERTEDQIIAYTWQHLLNYTSEYYWLLRCPMTKASVMAMDAIQDFAKKKAGISIEKFVVAGASKRGWTTWMVGAVQDPRVVAIVPIVAPVGNIIPQFNEQYQSYGGFSFAIKPYAEEKVIPNFLNTDKVKNLLKYINPVYYQEAMAKIPKYVIVASQDEFFMPDSARYYWDSLPGEKYLWVVQNADHSLALNVVEVVSSITEFYLSTFDERHLRPTYHWNITNEGKTIRFTDTSKKGNIVIANVWMGQDNPNRDWRFVTCGNILECINLNAFFKPFELTPVSNGVYEYTMEEPLENHYTAFYIEVEYQILDDVMRVTSDMSILPKNKYPFPPCGEKCTCGWKCPDDAMDSILL